MLLSIITPTFKRVKFLEKNLKIIDFLYSFFKKFEWIIVAEKSDKKTINFLKKNKKKYLKYIIGTHLSAELAFEKGIKKSKGKFINFHGDDDFYNLKNLKLINEKLFLTKSKWIIFDGNYINENFKIIRKLITFVKSFLLKNYGIIDLSTINYIMTPSVFVQKKAYKKIGGLGIIKRSGSDYILWMKFNKKHRPKIIQKKLTFAMISSSTISGKFELEKYFFLYRKMIENNKGGLLNSILITTSISLVIFYNFVSKKIINK